MIRKANFLRLISLFFGWLIFCSATPRPSLGDAIPLSLPEAIAKALKQNPGLIAQQHAVEAAERGRDLSRSRFFPRLDVMETYSRTNNPVMAFSTKLGQEVFSQSDFDVAKLNDPRPIGNVQTRLVLTQPVFNQGKEWLGYKRSGAQHALSMQEERAARHRTTFGVEVAYLGALLARAHHDVITEALSTAERHVKLAESLEKHGMALKSDVLSAKVHHSSLKLEEIQARNALSVISADLNRLMGEPLEREFMLADTLTASPGSSFSLDRWTEAALQNRPELAQMAELRRLGQIRTREARWALLPSVNLQGAYEWNQKDPTAEAGDNWTIMATASLNVFNGLGDKASMAQASAEERRLEYQMNETRDRIRMEVKEAFLSLKAAQERLDTTANTVEEAREALRIIQNRYQSGLATIVDLLDSEVALKKAQTAHWEALHDCRISQERLRWASGVIGEPS